MNSSEIILQDIKKAVLSVDKSADVLLFGSRARGDFQEESDWDILILTNEEITGALRFQFYSSVFDVQLKHSVSVGLIIKTRVEWYSSLNTDLYINVHEDGIVL